MQVLPLLVQLPDLRAQGSFNQHVYLPALCHEPSLRILLRTQDADTKTPRLAGRGVFVCYRNACSGIFVFAVFILPHGEFTGSGESGLYSEARKNPAVENVPGGKNAHKDQ
jgi:hypothetical protein